MKKKFLALALAASMLFPTGMTVEAADVWNGAVGTKFAGGSGTEGDPYQIATPAQFAYFIQQVGKGDSFKDQYIVIMDDLDFGGLDLKTVASYSDSYSHSPFAGHLDGLGHTLSNCKIVAESKYGFGIFWSVSGSIMNVALSDIDASLADASFSDFQKVGGILARNLDDAYLENILVTECNVVLGSMNDTGILAGSASYSTLVNCDVVNSSISATSGNVGGLLGDVDRPSTFIACDSTENTIHGSVVGGVVGDASVLSAVSMSYCTSTSTLSGRFIGGLVGEAESVDFQNCYVGGTIIADNDTRQAYDFNSTYIVYEQSDFNQVVANVQHVDKTDSGNFEFRSITFTNDVPVQTSSNVYIVDAERESDSIVTYGDADAIAAAIAEDPAMDCFNGLTLKPYSTPSHIEVEFVYDYVDSEGNLQELYRDPELVTYDVSGWYSLGKNTEPIAGMPTELMFTPDTDELSFTFNNTEGFVINHYDTASTVAHYRAKADSGSYRFVYHYGDEVVNGRIIHDVPVDTVIGEADISKDDVVRGDKVYKFLRVEGKAISAEKFTEVHVYYQSTDDIPADMDCTFTHNYYDKDGNLVGSTTTVEKVPTFEFVEFSNSYAKTSYLDKSYTVRDYSDPVEAVWGEEIGFTINYVADDIQENAKITITHVYVKDGKEEGRITTTRDVLVGSVFGYDKSLLESTYKHEEYRVDHYSDEFTVTGDADFGITYVLTTTSEVEPLTLEFAVDPFGVVAGKEYTVNATLTNNGTTETQKGILTIEYPADWKKRPTKQDVAQLAANDDFEIPVKFTVPDSLKAGDEFTIKTTYSYEGLEEDIVAELHCKVTSYSIEVKVTSDVKEVKVGDEVPITLTIKNTCDEVLHSVKAMSTVGGDWDADVKPTVENDGKDAVFGDLQPGKTITVTHTVTVETKARANSYTYEVAVGANEITDILPSGSNYAALNLQFEGTTHEPSNSPAPTNEPSNSPAPTNEPSNSPAPTTEPTQAPTNSPVPTNSPAPTAEPTNSPAPTQEPTQAPTNSPEPTNSPAPTNSPNPYGEETLLVRVSIPNQQFKPNEAFYATVTVTNNTRNQMNNVVLRSEFGGEWVNLNNYQTVENGKGVNVGAMSSLQSLAFTLKCTVPGNAAAGSTWSVACNATSSEVPNIVASKANRGYADFTISQEAVTYSMFLDNLVNGISSGDTVTPGTTLTCDLLLKNTSNTNVNNVVVKTSNDGVWQDNQSNFTTTDNGRTRNIGTLTPNQTVRLQLKVQVPANAKVGDKFPVDFVAYSKEISNVQADGMNHSYKEYTIIAAQNNTNNNSGNNTNNSGTSNSNVQKSAVSISVVENKTQFNPGEDIVYSVRVSNNSNAALSNVQVTASNDGTWKSTNTSHTAQGKTLTIPTLNAGQSETVTFTMTLPAQVQDGTKVSNSFLATGGGVTTRQSDNSNYYEATYTFSNGVASRTNVVRPSNTTTAPKTGDDRDYGVIEFVAEKIFTMFYALVR